MRTRRPQEKRRGAALVEMAMTLPLFLTIILGIVEFGRAMMVSQLLTNSAREAARQSVMNGSTNAETEKIVRDFLTDVLGVSAADITVTITVTEALGNPPCGNDVSLAQRRDLCTVMVKVPFDKVSFVGGEFLASKQLLGQCAMRHE